MEKILLTGVAALLGASAYIGFADTNSPPTCVVNCPKGTDKRHCSDGKWCTCNCTPTGWPECTLCQ